VTHKDPNDAPLDWGSAAGVSFPGLATVLS
jgi:hypothetical protein